jgi:hypothetical protein
MGSRESEEASFVLISLLLRWGAAPAGGVTAVERVGGGGPAHGIGQRGQLDGLNANGFHGVCGTWGMTDQYGHRLLLSSD